MPRDRVDRRGASRGRTERWRSEGSRGRTGRARGGPLNRRDRGRPAGGGDADRVTSTTRFRVITSRALARRARRTQARAAPHLVRDVARPARHGRRPLHQVRGGGRRGDEDLSPARRPVDLRRPGADGAAVQPAADAGRRLRQFRLDRRRSAGGDALYRVPADADRPDAAERAARADGRLTGPIMPRRPRSRSSCPRSSRTCWSTASRGSPSAWRPTSRRTT